MSYQEPPPLDFGQFDLACLCGNNGVGKSSLLEAITWVIWGKTRAASDDDLVHQGTTNMWVDFTFEQEGRLFRVFRQRSLKGRGSSSLEFFSAENPSKAKIDHQPHWKNLTEGTIRLSQEKIIDNLRLPYDIFVNSSYLRQGHTDEFTIKPPNERKQILSEILGLHRYDYFEEKAREKVRESSQKMETLEWQIEEIKNSLEDKNKLNLEITAINQEIKQQQKTIDQDQIKQTKLEEKVKKLDFIERELQQLRQTYSDHQTKINQLIEENSQNTQAIIHQKNLLLNQKQIEQQYRELNQLRAKIKISEQNILELRNLENQLQPYLGKKDDLEKNIQKIKKMAVCPTCRRKLTSLESQKIINQLKDEFQKNYGLKIQLLEKKISKLNFDPRTHDIFKKRLEELEPAEQKFIQIGPAKITLEHLETNIQKNNLQINQMKSELTVLKKRGEKQKILTEQLFPSKIQWQEMYNQIDYLRTALAGLHHRQGELEQKLKYLKIQEKSLQEKEKSLKENLEQKEIYQELALAFGKKGVQALIISRSIPAIEGEANRLIAYLTQDRMRISLTTQKTKKSDDQLMETLEIKISDEVGERSYEMYSGGEGFRINFALRIALAKLLAMRAGAHLKFLVIDEGFGMLDNAGREDLVAAINSIRDDFAKILVVTHMNEIKDLFPFKINVTKETNGSQIEIIS